MCAFVRVSEWVCVCERERERPWPCVWAMDLQIRKYVSPWFESQSLSSWQVRCCIRMVCLASFLQHSDMAVELNCCFTSTETVGLSGTGAQDVRLLQALRHGSKCKAYYTPAAGPSLDGVRLLCCSRRFHGTRNVHSPHAGRQGELQSAGYDCTENRENTTPELSAGGAKCIW